MTFNGLQGIISQKTELFRKGEASNAVYPHHRWGFSSWPEYSTEVRTHLFQVTVRAVTPVMRRMQMHGHAAANITVCAAWSWQEHVRHARLQHCRHSVANTSKGASKRLCECKQTMMDVSLEASDSHLFCTTTLLNFMNKQTNKCTNISVMLILHQPAQGRIILKWISEIQTVNTWKS
jgi:hypothetical protein